ncbi:MAG: hypothetical protein KAH18_01235 [Psychromonas sp.]|nr:hypothetical protein [Psychromonas sp.]
MSFLTSLFSRKKPAPTRRLMQPCELQLNDIFTFSDSFSLPNAMRKQQFQVAEINTIEFKYDHYASIIGRGGSDHQAYLSFPKKLNKQVQLSLLLTRDQVDKLFSLDAFADVFNEPGDARLTPLTESHPYGDMVADEYLQQNFKTSGYLHAQDYRNSEPPQLTDDEHGREFEFYSLTGVQENRSVHIFIFENGDTDVYLSSIRPINEISELWEKNTK